MSSPSSFDFDIHDSQPSPFCLDAADGDSASAHSLTNSLAYICMSDVDEPMTPRSQDDAMPPTPHATPARGERDPDEASGEQEELHPAGTMTPAYTVVDLMHRVRYKCLVNPYSCGNLGTLLYNAKSADLKLQATQLIYRHTDRMGPGFHTLVAELHELGNRYRHALLMVEAVMGACEHVDDEDTHELKRVGAYLKDPEDPFNVQGRNHFAALSDEDWASIQSTRAIFCQEPNRWQVEHDVGYDQTDRYTERQVVFEWPQTTQEQITAFRFPTRVPNPV